MNRNTLLKAGTILVAGYLLTGCGSSKSSDGGFGSASSSSTSSNSLDPADTTYTSCSKSAKVSSVDSAGNRTAIGDVAVQVKAYVDQFGTARNDLVRLKFVTAPQLWQDQNWDMKMFRWIASPDGSSTIDTTPLTYQFERSISSGYQLLSTNSYPIFNWTEVTQMADYANQALSANLSSSSPAAFFSQVSLLVNLKDTTNSYQVLRMVFYSGASVMREIEILIPSFQADPTRYANNASHPSALVSLHPLYAQKGQNFSQTQFKQMADANCF